MPGLWNELVTFQTRAGSPNVQTTNNAFWPSLWATGLGWINIDTTSQGARGLIVTTWDSSCCTQGSEGKADSAGQQHAANCGWSLLWFYFENTKIICSGKSKQTHFCYNNYSSVLLHYKQTTEMKIQWVLIAIMAKQTVVKTHTCNQTKSESGPGKASIFF